MGDHVPVVGAAIVCILFEFGAAKQKFVRLSRRGALHDFIGLLSQGVCGVPGVAQGNSHIWDYVPVVERPRGKPRRIERRN